MKMSDDDKIRRVAAAAAQEIIDKAASTAAALAATTSSDISYIKTDIATIKGMLDNKYATKEELKPVKMIAYGMVALIMVCVVGGLMLLLFKTGGTP